MDLKDLYRDVILDHNRSPRLFGRLDPADRSVDDHNPLCGHRLHVSVRLEGDRLSDLRFEGKGCAISVASASMMCEAVKGKHRDEIAHLYGEIHNVLTHHDAPVPEDLGKLAALSGVREFPVRVKCASLAWHTRNTALERSERDGQDRIANRNHAHARQRTFRPEPRCQGGDGARRDRARAQVGTIGIHHPGAGRQLHAIHGRQSVPDLWRRCRRHRQGPCQAAGTSAQRHRGRCARCRVEQLRTCYDPEIPINIVDLGLIYECTVSVQADGQRVINVRLTLTAPGCGMGDVLVQDIEAEAGDHSDRGDRKCRAGVRSAMEPVDDDRGRAPATGMF